MTSSDLLVALPWAAFGAALLAVLILLGRSGRR
jgi:hypothetical protein